MKDQKVMNLMISEGSIPLESTFDVTNDLIDRFYEIYGKIYSNIKNNKGSNVRYAKKLAGLSLMKLNLSRGNLESIKHIKKVKPKCGIVYLISNPVFPNLYKIGITQDLNKRLSQYQTGDPHRLYKIEHYKFVEDRREEEKRFLSEFKTDLLKGEWVNSERIKEMFYS